MGEGEQVSREGDGAGQREEVPGTDVDEEVLWRCSGWGCKKEQAGEGEKGSDGGGPAWGWRVCGTKGWDDGKRGTKTTTRPVIKADLAAVVRARPVVWN